MLTIYQVAQQPPTRKYAQRYLRLPGTKCRQPAKARSAFRVYTRRIALCLLLQLFPQHRLRLFWPGASFASFHDLSHEEAH